MNESLLHHLKGCQLDGKHAAFAKCTSALLAKVGKLMYNAASKKEDELDPTKFAKIEAAFWNKRRHRVLLSSHS